MQNKTGHGDHAVEAAPEEVSWALHHLIVAAAALDITLGRRLKLSPSEYQAMKHLMTSERQLGPVELGALVGLTSGSATTLVDRLEQAGHLARRRDGKDRRRITLEPTATALRSAREQLRPLEAGLDDVLRNYSTEERHTITQFLNDATKTYKDFNHEPD
ncbi:hypothetical protein GCM10027403_15930 [Arthrobacter tecti]